MTDTTLKFGPEWLRALTEPQQGPVNYTPPLPHMKLADYRYGREEMLALFDKDVLPPDNLLALGTLFVEKCQFPLNLIQMCDEETRAWQKGANSDASLRPFGNHSKRSNSPNRGRAKCRGGTGYPDYDRKKIIDEESEYTRSRNERESKGYMHCKGRSGGVERFSERGWFDLGEKTLRDEDRDGSPRKGYTKAPCDDWRGGKGDGIKSKDECWRQGVNNRGWIGSTESSWRNESSSESGKNNEDFIEDGKNTDRWRREDKNQPSRLTTDGKKKLLQNLPEWVMENPTNEAEGGFDESGKFKSEILPSVNRESCANSHWGEVEKWNEDEEVLESDVMNLAKDTSTEILINTHGEKRHFESYSPGVSISKQNEIEMTPRNKPDLQENESNDVLMEKKSLENSVDETTWTYLDPQGQVQGPFKSEEMLEWFSAGYFPHDLMIRRNYDSKFTSLAEMSKLYGKNPFTPGPVPPPFHSDIEHIKQQQFIQLHQLYMQQQQQQHMLAQQQLLLMQQQQSPALTRMYHNVVTAVNDPLGNLLMNLNKSTMDNQKQINFSKSVPEHDLRRETSCMDPKTNLDVPLKNSPSQDLDPIQSLLQQLQDKQGFDLLSNQQSACNSPGYSSSVYEDQLVKSNDNDVRDKKIATISGDALDKNVQIGADDNNSEDIVVSEELNDFQSIEDINDLRCSDEREATVFQLPKSSEKRERKNKKAEEKRKARSAKIQKGDIPVSQCIPGMPDYEKKSYIDIGKQTVTDQTKSETSTTSSTDIVYIDESDKSKEKCSKPAPWANKTNSNCIKGTSLSLQDIQKLEAEKERIEKAARDLADSEKKEERKRREEDERMKRSGKSGNWATASLNSGFQRVKSLAEIQEEEAKSEKEKQEKDCKEQSKKTKDSSLKLKPITSWAGKLAAATVTTSRIKTPEDRRERVSVGGPDGFWEPVTSQPKNKAPSALMNKKKKKPMEDDVTYQLTKQFDDWCKISLEGLNAQVDIPTFLSFLRDIESPYEVHDYIKTYVGEGKAQKRFAVEYIERRSHWKNAMRRSVTQEDDLTTPAYALIPGDGDFQEASRKNKKKGKHSKSNLNHLLGFSIRGQGVNRGELDIPQ